VSRRRIAQRLDEFQEWLRSMFRLFGWISFQRSQAKRAPEPAQRSAAKVRRALIASRVSRDRSMREG
jgi:hypothetical protein